MTVITLGPTFTIIFKSRAVESLSFIIRLSTKAVLNVNMSKRLLTISAFGIDVTISLRPHISSEFFFNKITCRQIISESWAAKYAHMM